MQETEHLLTIPWGEMPVPTKVRVSTIISSTIALLVIELPVRPVVTVLAKVHNVPTDEIHELRDKGIAEAIVIEDVVETEQGPRRLLRRILIGDTEYHLTP